jgi:hypothetical protein
MRVCGLCFVTCLAAFATANAQYYPPMTGAMPGPVYGDPNTSTLYSPNGPQATFGPADGYSGGMMGQDLGMLSQDGMAQPGEMQNLNYAQSLGDYGSFQMYGDPNGDGSVGANYRAKPATWAHVRDFQIGVYSNEDQTVINGGSTLEFYVDDSFGLGGRVLLGGVNNDIINDEFTFSGDLHAGTTRIGEHWVKGGVLYDLQDNFHKFGPVLGALLFADRKHPLSLDVAYGIGYGDPEINRVNSTITTVADDDTQVRVGTYLTPNLQAGFSGNWWNWSDKRFIDYEGYGGFVNLNLGTLNINVDFTHGDDRSRGFVNLAYVFGGRRSRAIDGCDLAYVEHPRDWLGKPVMRDVSLQIQTVQVANLPPLPSPNPGPPQAAAVVGNLTQVNFRLAAGSGGLDGIVDPGETFTIDVQLVNGSGVASNAIATGNVTSTSNLGNVLGGTGVVGVGTLLTGQQTSVVLPDFGVVLVQNVATNGAQFFIDFDVSADGQNRRFRVPITVGTSSTAAGFSPAIPL